MTKFGVELEVEVKKNPDKATQHTSEYVIYGSYPKHNNMGHIHKHHGNIVSLVDSLTKDKIKTYYDNTVDDGFEWVGAPLTLKQNIDLWVKVLTHPKIAPFIHGDDVQPHQGDYNLHDCGMHVHVSSDEINPLVLGRLLEFVNTKENAPLIVYMANRALNQYCGLQPNLKASDAQYLYHALDCSKTSKQGKKIEMKLNGTWDVQKLGGGYCCNNGMKVLQLGFSRSAIWVAPTLGGDYEIRIFKSTVKPERFIANLEFCAAMVEFCVETSDVSAKKFGKWVASYSTTYPDLFQLLRKGGFTTGVIRSRAIAA